MKNKDVLVFFSFKKHKTGYYKTLFNPLKSVEKQYGVTLHQGSLKDLHIEVIDGSLKVTESMTGRSLDTFDYVRFELWLKSPQQALAAATYLDRKAVPFSGHEAIRSLCTTKIGELVRMSDSGLRIPKTFTSSSRETLRAFKKTPPIAYPLIVKAADTFGGKMNYLVQTYKELETVLGDHPEQFFVVQEFIPNDSDYRFLIMDNDIKLVMKRSRTDLTSHLNNTSVGAVGQFVPVDSLPLTVRNDALKAAQLTYRQDFAGVDMMIHSGTSEHYVLEVNEAPAIQTGESPAIKIAALMTHIAEMTEKKKQHHD